MLTVDNAPWVYLSHNCDEIDSRGIQRILLTDHTIQTIVKGDLHTVAGVANQPWDTRATEGAGMAFTESHMVWLQSSWDAPLRVHAGMKNLLLCAMCALCALFTV